MEAGQLNSITDWATSKWTSSHYGVPEMHTPGMSKTSRNHSLCHAQVKGQERPDNVPVMCVCSESRRGPHTRHPSALWALETTCDHKPRVLGGKGEEETPEGPAKSQWKAFQTGGNMWNMYTGCVWEIKCGHTEWNRRVRRGRSCQPPSGWWWNKTAKPN